jgi:hypothetical protein
MMRLALVLALLAPAPSSAMAAERAHRTAPPGTVAPDILPAREATAASVQPPTWLVGARPGAPAQSLASRLGAKLLTPRGIYAIPAGRARAFARGLRTAGAYRFAEPNRLVRPAQAGGGVDEFAATDWRAFLIPSTLTPPPATSAPLTAVIDDAVDTTHPDLAGVRVIRHTAVTDLHGTAVASAIGGRANGVGMVGVYPGAPILSVGTDLTIGDIIGALTDAEAANASVVNMSFGGPDYSYALETELGYAVSQDMVPVASAGNDRDTQLPDGTVNPVMYPAALAHVVSVAAMGPNGATSDFSTSNGAVDLSAPGESVLTAVPVAFDDDGVPDGYERLDGTSFAAPIVAGVAAWIRAARPQLAGGQVADLMRFSAQDMGRKGWDEDSGYGLVNLPGALKERAPAVDRGEVNDDIAWVNGQRFTRPDPFLFRAHDHKRTVRGTVDWWKDYADVYRVQIPKHRTLTLTMRMPPGTNPDLAAFNTRAHTIYKRRGLLATSYHRAGKTERLRIRNRGRHPKVVYAVVYSPTSKDDFYDASYKLTIRR